MNRTLHHILQRHLTSDADAWLEQQLTALQEDFKARSFYLAFGACARHIGNKVLEFSESDYSSLAAVYPNFAATDWTADELG
ncbi:MAG: hypothetical protein WA952_00795, partial [Lewinella sp.]